MPPAGILFGSRCIAVTAGESIDAVDNRIGMNMCSARVLFNGLLDARERMFGQ